MAKFNNQTLTTELSEKIIGELFRYGIYRSMKISDEIKQKWSSTRKGEFSEIILTDEEVDYILENNPQSHKEAGFEKG